MPNKKIVLTVAVAAAFLAGCGPDKSREDSSDLKRVCHGPEDPGACIDKTPKRVIGFHNHYSNISESCDGYGHRIYVTTAEKVVVMTDPTCPGYVKQQPQAASAP